MRSPIVALGILLASASAFAQDPVTIDPAHHKVEVDNAQVRVLCVTLGPRDRTPLHDHPAGVMVFLTDSTYRVSPGAGASSEEARGRGDVLLTTAGKHALENLGTAPAEIVVVELKTPAIKPWTSQALDAVRTDPSNFRVIAENDEVRVLHATARAPRIIHEHPPYIYVVTAGENPGLVRYAAAAKHAPQNDAVTIMVELKTQPVATAHK